MQRSEPRDLVTPRVRAFLADRYPGSRGELARLGVDDPLWAVVSSMVLLELVDFLETAYRIEVEPLDYVPENFATLASVARFVGTRIAATGAPGAS